MCTKKPEQKVTDSEQKRALFSYAFDLKSRCHQESFKLRQGPVRQDALKSGEAQDKSVFPTIHSDEKTLIFPPLVTMRKRAAKTKERYFPKINAAFQHAFCIAVSI